LHKNFNRMAIEIEGTFLAGAFDASPVYAMSLRHRTHTGAPFGFVGYEYLRGIARDTSDEIVIQKGSQCGASELFIVFSISGAILPRIVMYVLPTFELKNMFVKTRVNPCIGFNPLYQQLVADADEKNESLSIKSFGKGMIIYVGTGTSVSFISHRVDWLIIDDVDRCDQDNLKLAPSRLSASEHKRVIQAGNPTVQNYGISGLYADSDRRLWHIRCQHCGKWVAPDFFRNVVRQEGAGLYVVVDPDYEEGADRVRMLCGCGQPLQGVGEWVAERPRVKRAGYQISKLFSTKDTIYDLLTRFNAAQENDTAMQVFYNMDLGLPYTASGAKLTPAVLDECIGDYLCTGGSGEHTVAGVDVGKVLNIFICQPLERLRVVYAGTVENPADVIALFKSFQVRCGVIDSMPETRMARQIAQSYRGVYLARFGVFQQTLQVQYPTKGKTHSGRMETIVSVDRTAILDETKEMFTLQRFELPKNARSIPGLYDQLCASTRIFDDRTKTFRWVETGPDHYFFAAALAIVARKMLVAHS